MVDAIIERSFVSFFLFKVRPQDECNTLTIMQKHTLSRSDGHCAVPMYHVAMEWNEVAERLLYAYGPTARQRGFDKA